MPTAFRHFMKTKKLSENHETYHRFLTILDYFATGEGRSTEINLCFANSEEEAKNKHLDRFYGNDQSARNYFGVGIEVMPFESKRAKDLFKNVFRFGKGFHQDLCKAGLEFYFKAHVNHS